MAYGLSRQWPAKFQTATELSGRGFEGRSAGRRSLWAIACKPRRLNETRSLLQVKFSDISNIGKALDDGWVITFPQGTTRPWKPIRKGTAHIIKTYQPIVVPIVIDGFRRSFDRKGIYIKKKGILQSMVIKDPLEIDYENESVDSIIENLEFAIEQHPSFLKVIPEEELLAYNEDHKKREFPFNFGSQEQEDDSQEEDDN